jgi:dynein heavy chain
LDSEQKKRLELLAKTKKMESLETTALIIEVNNDYARTMNKIIFERYLDETNELDDPHFPKHLNLPSRADTEKETPYFGMQTLER